MSNSATLYLEQALTQMGMPKAVDALLLMKEEMCAEKDFKRHNGDHYYYHLVDVTLFLVNMGITYEPCIIASLLHDYQEDVPGVTQKMIELMFGNEVAIYVNVLSKKPWINYSDPYNMQIYLDDIGEFLWTALIKAADRMHNVSTLEEASFEKRMKQAIETETYFIPWFKEMRNKYPRQAKFFRYAKTHVLPTIRFIKEYQTELASKNEEILKLKEELAESNFILEGLRK